MQGKPTLNLQYRLPRFYRPTLFCHRCRRVKLRCALRAWWFQPPMPTTGRGDSLRPGVFYLQILSNTRKKKPKVNTINLKRQYRFMSESERIPIQLSRRHFIFGAGAISVLSLAYASLRQTGCYQSRSIDFGTSQTKKPQPFYRKAGRILIQNQNGYPAMVVMMRPFWESTKCFKVPKRFTLETQCSALGV